jgi:hypothetical protein
MSAGHDDLIPLTPAEPTNPGRWGNMKPKSRTSYLTPPPTVDTPVPSRPDPYDGKGRRLNGFYCRVVTGGLLGGASGTVYRAYAADDCLLLVDTTLVSLDADKHRGNLALAALAGGIDGAVLEGAVGKATAAKTRIETITSALEQADEKGVRAYLKGDKNGQLLPAAGLRGLTIEPLGTFAKLGSDAVAVAQFKAAVGSVTGLHLLSLHDLGPAIGELTRLSGGTARVAIDWTAI